MTTFPQQDEATMISVRAQRADLHAVLIDLEASLAAPAPGREANWAASVHDRLVDVAAAFERHIAVTEGPGGLFDSVRKASPRLSNDVERLGREHNTIRADLSDALVAVRDLARGQGPGTAAIREQALEAVKALSRHRQLGADLVYECYAVDLGGGD